MPISVTNYFNLDRKIFENTGAFDALLDWDTLLFVDPYLLKDAQTAEFIGSQAELLTYFRRVIKLISHSKKTNDKAWREAVNRMLAKEIAAFGLGYSGSGSEGSGIGFRLATSLITTMKEIVTLGLEDPELFELAGLFEDGFGADRISDMTCNILIERFAEFTERVFKECNSVKILEKIKINKKTFNLPKHPFRKNQPILLCPKELLLDLPTAENGITSIFNENAELRNRINEMFGMDWSSYTQEKEKEKSHHAFTKHGFFLEEILKKYKNSGTRKYDFLKDPSGEVFWRTTAEDLAKKFPLNISKETSPSLEYYVDIVRIICDAFKRQIEQNGLWEVLYGERGKSKKERISQRLFFSLAQIYCSANNLDISPESNTGRGPVDFKFSHGSKNKIILEMKLSTNQKLLVGYTEQLEAYKKSEQAAKAFYLVVVVGDHDGKIKKLFDLKNQLASAEAKDLPEILTIDANKKLSASKLRKEKN